MRTIPKSDHEALRQKLAALKELLQDPGASPLLQEYFDTEEVSAGLEKLQQTYTRYQQLITELEAVILQYRFYQFKMSNQLRVKFRLLHGKLDSNMPERKRLGLPPMAPLRTKISFKPPA